MSDGTLPDIAQLEAQVRRRLRGWAWDIRLTIRDQGLVLQGCARTYYAKQLAQQVLMETAGLRILANEIDVSSNPDGRDDDGATPSTAPSQGL